MFFFFFSSRRRHTRWTGDWSSDVCSSDLVHHTQRGDHKHQYDKHPEKADYSAHRFVHFLAEFSVALQLEPVLIEIGRASCRERVYISVVDVALKKIDSV